MSQLVTGATGAAKLQRRLAVLCVDSWRAAPAAAEAPAAAAEASAPGATR